MGLMFPKRVMTSSLEKLRLRYDDIINLKSEIFILKKIDDKL